MDSEVKIYIERADNEILLAKINFEISTIEKIKEILNIGLDKTFFNNVISGSYYSIFYAAKAYLLSKGIKTSVPEEHKKTYKIFKRYVKSGILNKQLLDIYEIESGKAEALLDIFFKEKKKRGTFTYNMKSEANIPVAQESINNARIFVSLIKKILEGKNEL